MSSTKVPVGQCSTCGIVVGEEVDFRFPNPARCECGADLERATLVEEERLAEIE